MSDIIITDNDLKSISARAYLNNKDEDTSVFYDETTGICNYNVIMTDVTNVNTADGVQLYDCKGNLITGDKPQILRRTCEFFSVGLMAESAYGQIASGYVNVYKYHPLLLSKKDMYNAMLNYIDSNNLVKLYEDIASYNRPRSVFFDARNLAKNDCGVDLKMKADNPEKYPYNVLDLHLFKGSCFLSGNRLVNYTKDDTKGYPVFPDRYIAYMSMCYSEPLKNNEPVKFYLPHLNVPYYRVECPSLGDYSIVCNPDGTLTLPVHPQTSARDCSCYKVTYTLEDVEEEEVKQ